MTNNSIENSNNIDAFVANANANANANASVNANEHDKTEQQQQAQAQTDYPQQEKGDDKDGETFSPLPPTIFKAKSQSLPVDVVVIEDASFLRKSPVMSAMQSQPQSQIVVIEDALRAHSASSSVHAMQMHSTPILNTPGAAGAGGAGGGGGGGGRGSFGSGTWNSLGMNVSSPTFANASPSQGQGQQPPTNSSGPHSSMLPSEVTLKHYKMWRESVISGKPVVELKAMGEMALNANSISVSGGSRSNTPTASNKTSTPLTKAQSMGSNGDINNNAISPQIEPQTCIVYELNIMTKERKGLLAEISACLRTYDLSILSAKIFTLPNNSVIDLFRVADPSGILLSDTSTQEVYDAVLRVLQAPVIDPAQQLQLQQQQLQLSSSAVPTLQHSRSLPVSQPISPSLSINNFPDARPVAREVQTPGAARHPFAGAVPGAAPSSIIPPPLLGVTTAASSDNSNPPLKTNAPRDAALKPGPKSSSASTNPLLTTKKASTVPRSFSNLALYDVETEAKSEAQRKALDAQLQVMKDGEFFYVYSSHSHHRYRFKVKVSLDLKRLEWEKNVIEFKSCVGVNYGISAGIFTVLPEEKRPDPEWHCFSLLYRARDGILTMDLAATTDDQVSRWVVGLQRLIVESRNNKTGTTTSTGSGSSSAQPVMDNNLMKNMSYEHILSQRARMKLKDDARRLGVSPKKLICAAAVQHSKNRQDAPNFTHAASTTLDRQEIHRLKMELSASLDREAVLKSRLKATQQAWEIDFVREVSLGERIGKGAFSDIWKGTWRASVIACKVLRAQDSSEKRMREFYDEVNLLSKLRHPNIVLFMAACAKPPHLCILTEFCYGGNIYSALRKPLWRKLNHVDFVHIARDAARGLVYLHACNIIHRDVKSQNILLDRALEDGRPVAKICDFGLSRELQKNEDADSAASSGGIMTNETGTYRWMAPEMIRHEKYSEKVDVYSFGVTLWEFFTCEIPFGNFSPIQAAFAVADKDARPEAMSEYGRANPIPVAWRALIEWCWATKSRDRPRLDQVVEVLNRMETIEPNHIPSILSRSASRKSARNEP